MYNKRWGIDSKERFIHNKDLDKKRNEEYKAFYLKQGVVIPDDVVNCSLEYCNNVRIVKNSYNVFSKEFDEFYQKKLLPIEKKYPNKSQQGWNMAGYLLIMLFGETIHHDRIQVIKKYQAGERDVIEQYINSIDYKRII